MNDLLSIPDVLELAECSVDTLRRWMRNGTFPRPSHKRGRNHFWTRSAVEKAVAKQTRRISASK